VLNQVPIEPDDQDSDWKKVVVTQDDIDQYADELKTIGEFMG